MRLKVLLLTVSLRYEIDSARPDIVRLGKAVGGWVRPAMHTRHSQSLLVVTNETPTELVDRIRPRLETLGAIENAWCDYASEHASSMTPAADPFLHYLALAWQEARKFHKPEDLRQARSGDILVKHGVKAVDSHAAVKMGLRGAWKRKPPTDPNSPQS